MKIALYLVFAVALAESALAFYRMRTPVPDADWTAATARVRDQMQPHDLVVAAPGWADPLLREHLGDRIPVSMAARSDADSYARIWELSIRGAHAEETKDMKPAFEEHVGKITVRRFDKAAEVVLRDLTADFAQARVTWRRAAKPGFESQAADENPCVLTKDGKGHQCGSAVIEPRVLEIDYQPRRGILAPAIANEVVSIAYDDVKGPGTLVGYAGLHDYYARKSADGVAFFRVHIDDAQTTTLPLRNDSGWKRFDMTLPPGKHRILFEEEAEKPASRLVGFHAEVRQVSR